jgi:hypothetical protein
MQLEVQRANGTLKRGPRGLWHPHSASSPGGAITAVDYIAGIVHCGALGATSMTADRLYAAPFLAPPRGGTLNRIGFDVTTAAASQNARIGLYDALPSETNPYPLNRLADSGDISVASTGLKTHAISQVLVPSQLYWLTFVHSGGTPGFRCFPSASDTGWSGWLGMVGTSGTLHRHYISVSFTYAALPAIYPSGGAFQSAMLCLRYRFAA